MAHKLADETLQAILLPVLAVTEADFADTSLESPFSRPGASGTDGAILLVCKRWMRVATPLFYHCVVLRTLPRAQALARTLKSNPAIAPLIKQLRIEGGLGAAGGKVMAAAKNAHDLCLFPDYSRGKAQVAALCSALPKIQPRRLILCEMTVVNSRLGRVINSLGPAFSTWTRFDMLVVSTSFFPFVYRWHGSLRTHKGGVTVHLIGEVRFYNIVERLLKIENVSVLVDSEDYFSYGRRHYGIKEPEQIREKYRKRFKFTDDVARSAGTLAS